MCHPTIAKSGLIVGLIAAGFAPASEAQIYDNGAPNWFNGNEMTTWIQAEDFNLLGAFSVTGVRFWGFENRQGAYTGDVYYQFFTDNAGQPGAALAGGLVTPTALSAECLDWAACWQLDFSTNVALGPGTYWLGLHNGPLTTADRLEFYWAATAGNTTLTGHEDQTPFGDNSWYDNGEEHAFQLYASADTTVPEPASLALVATGLVGLAGAGLLRRKR
jgi:hypothetical protein